MKKKYYVNSQAQLNGDHEVHVEDCRWMPIPERAIYFGEFASCHEAVREAAKKYRQVNGCKTCSNPCHTQ